MVSAADRAKGPARTSVWTEHRTSRGRRGSQPAGLDRGRIVDAAVRLLDAEGLAKFSMRRLAAELDVTAMSIYWYIDTKDDLLELALDAAFGTLRLPDGTTPDGTTPGAGDSPAAGSAPAAPAAPAADTSGAWRERLRALAREYRALLVRHPWVSPLVGTYLNIGPHSMAFSLAVQQMMRDTGLPVHGQMGGVSAVFQFVYGFGTIEGHFIARCASAGMSQDAYFQEAMGTIAEEPQLRQYARSSVEIMEARGGDTVAEMRDRDFDYALELLVAGIEAMAARA